MRAAASNVSTCLPWKRRMPCARPQRSAASVPARLQHDAVRADPLQRRLHLQPFLARQFGQRRRPFQLHQVGAERIGPRQQQRQVRNPVQHQRAARLGQQRAGQRERRRIAAGLDQRHLDAEPGAAGTAAGSGRTPRTGSGQREIDVQRRCVPGRPRRPARPPRPAASVSSVSMRVVQPAGEVAEQVRIGGRLARGGDARLQRGDREGHLGKQRPQRRLRHRGATGGDQHGGLALQQVGRADALHQGGDRLHRAGLSGQPGPARGPAPGRARPGATPHRHRAPAPLPPGATAWSRCSGSGRSIRSSRAIVAGSAAGSDGARPRAGRTAAPPGLRGGTAAPCRRCPARTPALVAPRGVVEDGVGDTPVVRPRPGGARRDRCSTSAIRGPAARTARRGRPPPGAARPRAAGPADVPHAGAPPPPAPCPP